MINPQNPPLLLSPMDLLRTTQSLPPSQQGPRPLALHLMTLLYVWLSLPTAWRSLNNTLPNLTNDWLKPDHVKTPALVKLIELQNKIDPARSDQFFQALLAEATQRIYRFTAGVNTYHQYPQRRSVTPMPVIWRSGTTEVRDYNPDHPKAPVILVIPSLINRFDILDLAQDLSFLRWLVARGYRPLVVDWNEPGILETSFTTRHYLTERLIPFLDWIVLQTHAPVHILGYCMGGLLAVALAALQPRFTQTLICLATPWDFHQPDPMIGQEFIVLAEQLEPILKDENVLSVDLIQTLFSVLQPFNVITKFSSFTSKDMASPDAQRFVVIEDWLNDGVPLTSGVTRECILEWYGKNVTGRNKWHIMGQPIDPHMISIPSYIVVPERDQIVPPASALALARALPHATLHEPMMGHIGLMASKRAPDQVWAPLGQWLSEHS